jgi:hypothetical protein
VLVLSHLPAPALAQDAAPAPDPGNTRLFFGPTARALPAGKAYVGGYQAVVPFAQAGLTDRLSLGAGVPLPFGGGLFWLTPKLQILDTGRTQAAIGAVHVVAGDLMRGGVAYGVVTTGGPDTSVTAGLGLAYGDGGRPIAMIGGERRTSRHSKFLTENYLVPGAGGFSINGIRLSGRKLSADFGVGLAFAGGVFAPFPLVNVAYLF